MKRSHIQSSLRGNDRLQNQCLKYIEKEQDQLDKSIAAYSRKNDKFATVFKARYNVLTTLADLISDYDESETFSDYFMEIVDEKLRESLDGDEYAIYNGKALELFSLAPSVNETLDILNELTDAETLGQKILNGDYSLLGYATLLELADFEVRQLRKECCI